MGITIKCFLQIDDNTPADEKPFTNTPSTWDLRHDYGLFGCKDYIFISAISGLRIKDDQALLYPLRGMPKDSGADDINEFSDEENVGWLTAREIRDSIAHIGASRNELMKPVSRLLKVIDTLASDYGDDRIRLIFSIFD